MDFLRFDLCLSVLICTCCQYALVPGAVAAHLNGLHKDEITRANVRRCVETCRAMALRQPREVQIRDIVIKKKDLLGAGCQLLALPSLKRFFGNLKSAAEKDDFRRHMRRYLSLYMPDCAFEISGTNRYTVTAHEANIIRGNISGKTKISSTFAGYGSS